MTVYQRLLHIQQTKQTRLCVGLDPLPGRLPKGVHRNVAYFLLEIFDATLPYSCAYKFNLAFFERMGSTGLHTLEHLLRTIYEVTASEDHRPILIADVKRSDVPHTAATYASAYLDFFPFDAVTVNPLLGSDSIQPFLRFSNSLVFLLAVTSNPGASDFLLAPCGDRPLFERIVEKTATLASHERIGYVVGATYPEIFRSLRSAYPSHFFLVPGIGAQGGDMAQLREANQNRPALFSISRSILYASLSIDFAEAARRQAERFQQESW